VLLLLFSPSTGSSNPLAGGKPLPGLDLSPSRFDGIFRDTCFSCDQDDVSPFLGFSRQKLPPLLLIEQLTHLLIFFLPIILLHAQKSSTSSSFGQLI
jgi:hypothetical protein